ncbi:MAG: CBS domain-containing protein [Myxococcales bacterium]|nr:CBS domain-containing protein [Myxococcales bacterium]
MEQIKQTVSSLMLSENLPICDPETMVASALAIMRDRHVGCVVVANESMVVGIFTERDLLRYMATHNDNLAEIAVRNLMTRNPETLGPKDCVSYAINMMVIGGYRNIPIVDNDAALVGLITARDVTEHLSELLGGNSKGQQAIGNEWQDIGGG